MNNARIHFNCRDLGANRLLSITKSANIVSLVHRKEDPSTVNRIIASIKDFKVEILPSKGFSVGQIFVKGKPVLWNPPIGICDSETLDLFSDEIAINGAPAPGFTFLKTFSSGIEFYGLRNWGMPRYDKQQDFLHPIHGETSNIPVDFCDVEISDDEIILSTSFIYRDITDKSTEIWYKRGRKLFEVNRQVIIRIDNPQLQLIDTIKNISNEKLKPDWGYHITFLPQNGSRLLALSKSVENRSGEKIPDNFDRWTPAENSKLREETGIIHKNLLNIGSEDESLNCALLVHPDDTGIKIRFSPVPYFQTWLCKGGAFSNEFTRVSDGKPLFTKNWDGIGIEIGSSALDHNENTDPSVAEQRTLAPDESQINKIAFDFIYGDNLKAMAEDSRDNRNSIH